MIRLASTQRFSKAGSLLAAESGARARPPPFAGLDDIDCDIHCDDDAGRLHVNAPAAVDAWQHASCVSQSHGAIGNAAFLAINGRAHRRADVPGARQGCRCWPRR